jgi:hypothetical protein
MDGVNFEKSVVKKLVPHLPLQSVTVLDNVSSNHLQTDKPPSTHAIKAVMISWLCNRGVNCNETMWKN